MAAGLEVNVLKLKEEFLLLGQCYIVHIVIKLVYCILYIIMQYFSWSRWSEIIQHNDFRDGWKENDVEDLARIVVSVYN